MTRLCPDIHALEILVSSVMDSLLYEYHLRLVAGEEESRISNILRSPESIPWVLSGQGGFCARVVEISLDHWALHEPRSQCIDLHLSAHIPSAPRFHLHGYDPERSQSPSVSSSPRQHALTSYTLAY